MIITDSFDKTWNTEDLYQDLLKTLKKKGITATAELIDGRVFTITHEGTTRRYEIYDQSINGQIMDSRSERLLCPENIHTFAIDDIQQGRVWE